MILLPDHLPDARTSVSYSGTTRKKEGTKKEYDGNVLQEIHGTGRTAESRLPTKLLRMAGYSVFYGRTRIGPVLAPA